jgi:hypothetical protein
VDVGKLRIKLIANKLARVSREPIVNGERLIAEIHNALPTAKFSKTILPLT